MRKRLAKKTAQHPHPLSNTANIPSKDADFSMAVYDAAAAYLMQAELENKPRSLFVPKGAIPFLVAQGVLTEEQGNEALGE